MEKIEYKISKEIRDAVLSYLLSRPMAEVESGVQALRQLEKIKEEVKEEKEVKK